MSTLLLLVDGYLFGLSMTVLLVVYPAFRHVGAAQWSRFHQLHTNRIAIAVAPAWACQGVLTVWWLWRGTLEGWAVVQAVGAALSVLTTVLGAVPAHNRLGKGVVDRDVTLLQRWHLWRTLAWGLSLAAVALAR